jgi:tetratricopeptide (TPR) repeat protein
MALGSLLETNNQWQQAEDCYRNALEIQPSYAAAANNPAYLMLDTAAMYTPRSRWPERRGRGLPDSPSAADTLGWAYYNLGLSKSAIDLLREAVQANPKNVRYYYHLGTACEAAKES